MDSRSLEVRIIGDSKSLERAFGRSASATSGFGAKITKGAKIAGAGLVALGAGAVYFGNRFRKAAAEAEASQAKVVKSLENAGVSWKEHGKRIDETIQKHAALTGFDDEELAESFANIVRVTGDVNKGLEQNALAADIARERGMSLAQASDILAKVNIGNFKSLRGLATQYEVVTTAQDALEKSGKKFTDAQMKQAKATDLAATKQAALAALQKQFGGQAEAFGRTQEGMAARLGVAWENVQERIGAKLMPVMTKLMEWVLAHMPQIEATIDAVVTGITATINFLVPVVQTIIGWFKQLADFARQHWGQVQAAADRVVKWYQGTLAPTIQNVLTAITAFWNRFGGAITQIVRTSFGGVLAVVRTVLGNLASAIQIVMALIRGDWGKAWSELKEIPRRFLALAVTIVRGFASNFLTAARAIGAAAIDGIAAGLSALGAMVWEKLQAIPAKLTQLAAAIPGWASAIGREIIQGIASGMGALLQWLLGQVGSIVSQVKDKLMFWSSGPDEFGRKIGALLMTGMASGIGGNAGTAKLAASAAVKGMIDAAIAAVQERQSALQSALDNLVSMALQAFDKITDAWTSPTRKKMNLEDEARAEADRLKALADAQAQLATATSGGDPAAIAAATQSVADAEFAIRRAADEKLATQEEAAHAAQRERQRGQFENRLTKLQENLAAGRISYEQFTERLKALFEKNEIPFEKAAKKLGFALAAGLNAAFGAVAKAAKALAKEIVDRLSEITVRVKVELQDISPGGGGGGGKQHGGPVYRGMPVIVGERRPELFVPNVSGRIVPQVAMAGEGGTRGGGTVVFNFPNYVGSQSELAAAMQQTVNRWQRDNGGGFFPS